MSKIWNFNVTPVYTSILVAYAMSTDFFVAPPLFVTVCFILLRELKICLSIQRLS